MNPTTPLTLPAINIHVTSGDVSAACVSYPLLTTTLMPWAGAAARASAESRTNSRGAIDGSKELVYN